MTQHIGLTSILVLALTTGSAWANNTTEPEPGLALRGVFGLGLTGGGDELVSFTMTDGTTNTLTAGGIFHFYMGGRYQLQPKWAIQATLGYHGDSVTAKNGSASFSRYPLELIGQYRANEKIQLGGGWRMATGAHYSASGAAAIMTLSSVTMTPSIGWLIEGDYFFSDKGSFALRYVNESFKDPYNQTIDGSHLGFYVKGLF